MSAARSQTQAQALRNLLSDRRTHSTRELLRVAGHRFGARLHEIHWGERGPALHYVRTEDARSTHVTYRRATARDCTVCNAHRMSPTQTIKLLKAENASLRERLQQFLQD